MQTFSYLQRNIADKNYIKLAPIAAVLFLYGSISTLNPYLPPLFGVLMATAYFVGRREFLFFAFGYLLIFEADRGYYLFSGFLFLIFYVYYFLPFVAAFLDCKRCMAVVAVLCSYPLYYLFLSLVDMFFLKPGVSLSFAPIAFYLLFESLFALSME